MQQNKLVLNIQTFKIWFSNVIWIYALAIIVLVILHKKLILINAKYNMLSHLYTFYKTNPLHVIIAYKQPKL